MAHPRHPEGAPLGGSTQAGSGEKPVGRQDLEQVRMALGVDRNLSEAQLPRLTNGEGTPVSLGWCEDSRDIFVTSDGKPPHQPSLQGKDHVRLGKKNKFSNQPLESLGFKGK